MVASELISRLDLRRAVGEELTTRSRLLPMRPDSIALSQDAAAVAALLRPLYRPDAVGSRADVVFADKGFRGARPLHVMTLEDRTFFRALVNLLAQSLPEHLRHRISFADFRQAPLELDRVRYVSKTDITAYYEFVDHEVLADELIAANRRGTSSSRAHGTSPEHYG